MLIDKKEHKIFTTNAEEQFEKQIKDVPIFGCTICKRTCFRKNVIVMKHQYSYMKLHEPNA